MSGQLPPNSLWASPQKILGVPETGGPESPVGKKMNEEVLPVFQRLLHHMLSLQLPVGVFILGSLQTSQDFSFIPAPPAFPSLLRGLPGAWPWFGSDEVSLWWPTGSLEILIGFRT